MVIVGMINLFEVHVIQTPRSDIILVLFKNHLVLCINNGAHFLDFFSQNAAGHKVALLLVGGN